MKCLQDLVPGCNKITGKAGMLDEIINYVQSLQRQVEVRETSILLALNILVHQLSVNLSGLNLIYMQFLSMKLAAVNPSVELNVDNLPTKEVRKQSPELSFVTDHWRKWITTSDFFYD